MFCYIHIPFCESKCKYCRFASIWGINKILVQKYLSHLINDIVSFQRPVLKKTGLKLDSIYFWWWTPSILEKSQLQEIINTLKTKFWFKENIEITLETTPKNITLENILSWQEIWINRISIGIQTLNNKALKEINRDNRKTILDWLENLRPPQSPLSRKKLWKSRGIQNISVDFIIWLPYVKKSETLKDIKYILENYKFVKHISVYMLEDYYSSDNNDSNFEKISYPENWKWLWIEEKDYLEEYLSIKNYLEKNWFFRYEISNFAKKWYSCKHNKSYWNHKENIWFWLWSHSFVWWIRYAYKDDFIGYYGKKLDYEEKLEKKDIFLEKVLFWLRTSWIRKNIYKKLNMQKISEFINAWLLEIKNENLCITDKSVTIIDKIILEII